MKKFLIGLMCIIAAGTTAYAEESNSPVTVVQNGFNITVSYIDDDAFGKATLLLLDNEGNLIYMSEKKPDATSMNTVTFDTFKAPETMLTGEYIIKVGANGEIVPATLNFKNQLEREDKFLTLIKSTTVSEALTNIASASAVVDFGYNKAFANMSENFQKQICKSIIELNLYAEYEEDRDAGTNNAEELITIFCDFMDMLYEAVSIMSETSAEKVITKIDNAVFLEFDSTYFSNDVTANPLSAFVYDRESIARKIVDYTFDQRVANDEAYKPVDIDKLYELLNGNTLLHIINNNDYTTAEAALSYFKNSTYMNIDYTYYKDLNAAKKAAVFNSIKAENISDYKTIPSKFFEISKAKASSGGGTGGSGLSYQKPSGGSISVGIGGTIASQTETIAGFVDLGNVLWASEAISTLKGIGAISGVTENEYAPNELVTREASVTILVKAFGYYDENATSEFDDVNADSWSYPYVSSAYQNELIAGKADKFFDAKGNITREDAAVIINRAYSKKYGKVESNETFTDMDEVSEYAKEAVSSMKKLGIISGYEDGSFKPKNFITRAEIAQMIYNAYKLTL